MPCFFVLLRFRKSDSAVPGDDLASIYSTIAESHRPNVLLILPPVSGTARGCFRGLRAAGPLLCFAPPFCGPQRISRRS